MPTYEYVCDACSHELEQFQSITAEPLKKCPKCAKPKLRRLISSGGAVLFKGSGFYETDYRSESYKKAAEAEKKPASDAAPATDAAAKTSDAKGGESKPAEKKPAAEPAKPAAKSETPKKAKKAG